MNTHPGPMTGPDYRLATILAASQLTRVTHPDGSPVVRSDEPQTIALAQVYATLALAAHGGKGVDGSAVVARIERIERALREYDGWFDDELRTDRTSAEQAPVSDGLDYTDATERLRAASVTAVNDNYAASTSAEIDREEIDAPPARRSQ